MAGNDPQKQFLNIIRNFANERSHGERRIVNLKKQTEELRSELESASTELEEAKSCKEMIEQEIKGFEVELSMNETSAQTLQGRIALIQEKISKFAHELETIKSQEDSIRDDFIRKMVELNAQIRKFQDTVIHGFSADDWSEVADDDLSNANAQNAEKAKRDLEDKLAQIISQCNKEEEEYQSEQIIHEKVDKVLTDLEKKALLLDTIGRESIELHKLSQQTSELEEKYAFLGQKLQKRVFCPKCDQDNSKQLAAVL